MPSINLKESDFEVLANAANDAHDKGDAEQAKALDIIARKLNLAISISGRGNDLIRPARFFAGNRSLNLTWKDIPSTIFPR